MQSTLSYLSRNYLFYQRTLVFIFCMLNNYQYLFYDKSNIFTY